MQLAAAVGLDGVRRSDGVEVVAKSAAKMRRFDKNLNDFEKDATIWA